MTVRVLVIKIYRRKTTEITVIKLRCALSRVVIATDEIRVNILVFQNVPSRNGDGSRWFFFFFFYARIRR